MDKSKNTDFCFFIFIDANDGSYGIPCRSAPFGS